MLAAHTCRVLVDPCGILHRGNITYESWDKLRRAEHMAEHECSTREPVYEASITRRRKLQQSDDCTATFNNPADRYAPTSAPILTIRTVIHVITNGPTTGHISPECAASGIAWLNRDFRAAAGSKSAASVDTRIGFALATTDEHGNSTTGVAYHDNAAWFNQDASESGGLWRSLWDPTRYMNIYLKNVGNGALGSATLAQSSSAGGASDGIFINYDVWGDCATSGQYNQGATATREVGHYLGLLHTFESIHDICASESEPDCHQNGGERARVPLRAAKPTSA